MSFRLEDGKIYVYSLLEAVRMTRLRAKIQRAFCALFLPFGGLAIGGEYIE